MGIMAVTALSSGCQCTPMTARYGNFVDDVSDSKLELERFYVPGLDVSRIGMPDWRRFGWNHVLCKCNCRICRHRCHPVEYPAYYTLRYHEKMAETMGHTGGVSPQNFNAETIEEMPLPLPEPVPKAEVLPLPEVEPADE